MRSAEVGEEAAGFFVGQAWGGFGFGGGGGSGIEEEGQRLQDRRVMRSDGSYLDCDAASAQRAYATG